MTDRQLATRSAESRASLIRVHALFGPGCCLMVILQLSVVTPRNHLLTPAVYELSNAWRFL